MQKYILAKVVKPSTGELKALKSLNGMDYPDTSENGDEYYFYVYKFSNEAIIDLSYNKNTICGIFDLYINDVLDSSGYDGYAATAYRITTIC